MDLEQALDKIVELGREELRIVRKSAEEKRTETREPAGHQRQLTALMRGASEPKCHARISTHAPPTAFRAIKPPDVRAVPAGEIRA
jgi:hypothetical protein